MLRIHMAGLTVELNNRYPYTEKQCEAYRIHDALPADIAATCTDEEIAAELALEASANDMGCAESICLYRSVASQLYRYDALLMHGAVIGYGDKAYAFLAPSGTGKSTHIRLWHRYLGDAVFPVNGDKPILRLQNGVFTASGTPWAGKEGWQRNITLPLGGICLLKRGTVNTIDRLNPEEAVKGLMRQIYLPPVPEAALATMALADRLVKDVPMYLLACDMSEQAAKTSFEAMTGYEFEQSKGMQI